MQRLRDLPRLPLRDHGSKARVERVWQRVALDLGERPVWARPQTLWAPAVLVAVFGAGVFVGSRWLHPEAGPVLSAERPLPLETPAGTQAPPQAPAGPASPARRAVTPRRLHGSGLAPAAPASSIKLAPPIASAAPALIEPEWQRLAEAGDYEAARAAVESSGGFEAALAASSAPELMTLVDIARASGSRDRAVAALRRVVGFFRDAPEAPLAAWTLGNLLDQAGDAGGAAEAYALYRRLSPGGDFAEDALAREIDASLSLGKLELSARLIAQYENEFPNGRSLEEFRSELARRSERAAPAVDTAAQTDAAAPGDARSDGAPAKPARADDAPPPASSPED